MLDADADGVAFDELADGALDSPEAGPLGADQEGRVVGRDGDEQPVARAPERHGLDASARRGMAVDDLPDGCFGDHGPIVEGLLAASKRIMGARTGVPLRFPTEGGDWRAAARDAGGSVEAGGGHGEQPTQGLGLLGAGATIAGLPADSRAALLDLLLARSEDAITISVTDTLEGRWCPEIVHANPAHERLTGYASAEVLGRNPGLWAPHDRNAAAHAELCRRLARGEPARAELSVRTAGGEDRWVDSTVTPLGFDGERHYLLEVARDVTERHQLLAELEDREGQLHEAQELTNVGSWQWDIDNDTVAWSPEMYRIYGRDPAEEPVVTLQAYTDLIHPDHHKVMYDTVSRAFRAGEGFVFEFRTNRPEVQWLQSRGRVERDETGNRSVRIIGTTQDITTQKTSEESLRRQALHDALTGLPNRTLLADRLSHAMAYAARRDSCTAVLFVDIDDFKAVNDTFGHQAGDEALVEVARRLEASLRPSDTLARVGGDEFVAVCEDVASADDAAALAERIVDALVPPIRLVSGMAEVKVSVGVSVGASDDQPDTLIRRADTAMYEAKLAGGGEYRLYSS